MRFEQREYALFRREASHVQRVVPVLVRRSDRFRIYAIVDDADPIDGKSAWRDRIAHEFAGCDDGVELFIVAQQSLNNGFAIQQHALAERVDLRSD